MNNIRNVLSVFFLLTALCLQVQAQQSSQELQRQKEKLLRDIEDTKQDLASTQQEKKLSLSKLRGVEKKINLRTSVINTIKGEVYYVEKDIIRTYRDIDTLKEELKVLKEQYAQSVIYAYKNRSNYDFLNFLFSSANFGDVLRRVSYLKTYRSFREQKAGDITRTQEVMKEKIASLTGKRKQKTDALQEQGKQMKELEVERKEKDQIVAELSSKEKELRNMVAKKQKENQKVQAAIKAAIAREIAEAKRQEQARLAKEKAARDEAARRAAAANTSSSNGSTVATNNNPAPAKNNPPADANMTKPVQTRQRQLSDLENAPEVVMVSQDFEKNKGNMPWPVDRGNVSLHYGNNKIGKVIIPSDGVSWEVAVGSSAKAIFDGEVTSVSNIGDIKIVILKHGKYFTTYSNLQSASVSRGQKVSRGQVLGQVGPNDQGIGQLDLMMDTERGTINPEPWLKGM